MSDKLASLKAALAKNVHLIEELLQRQEYDEALQFMDERLALIDSLVQLASKDPAQRSAAAALAAALSIQEESIAALATSHHQTIFKQLTQFGRANKAGRAYRVNSKEF